MPDGVGGSLGAYADFDHLAVVPWSWSAQQAHKRGVRRPEFISAGNQDSVKDS
jgi:hypothetical protein